MKKRPSRPEAERRLIKLKDELRAHMSEYKPHETFVAADLLEWIADAVDERQTKMGSFDQALGLTRYRGEKEPKPGKYFTLACEIFEMLPQQLSWAQLSDKLGFDDVRELQKIWDRERDSVILHFAKELAARGAK